jgi:hypothetical protein
MVKTNSEALEGFIRRAWSVRVDRYSELHHLNND